VISEYNDVVQLIERLHRHFLDVLRTKLRHLGIEDVNAVQALLLSNIGDDDVVIRDLKDRGYYLGSNVSYNIKKLTENGYIAQERSPHDRRATRIILTDKGEQLVEVTRGLQQQLAEEAGRIGLDAETLKGASEALGRLERVWTDFIRHGGR